MTDPSVCITTSVSLEFTLIRVFTIDLTMAVSSAHQPLSTVTMTEKASLKLGGIVTHSAPRMMLVCAPVHHVVPTT